MQSAQQDERPVLVIGLLHDHTAVAALAGAHAAPLWGRAGEWGGGVGFGFGRLVLAFGIQGMGLGVRSLRF